MNETTQLGATIDWYAQELGAQLVDSDDHRILICGSLTDDKVSVAALSADADGAKAIRHALRSLTTARAEIGTLRAALSKVSEMDTHLVWTGGAVPEPSHEEDGEIAKIANAALATARHDHHPMGDASHRVHWKTLADIAPDILERAEDALRRANIKAHMLAEPTDPIECIANAIIDAAADERARLRGVVSWNLIALTLTDRKINSKHLHDAVLTAIDHSETDSS